MPHAFIGLLELGPKHGYTLKREFDRRFASDRPLRYGQVYATLARLQRDGWTTEVSIESGAGPDRKLYAVTDAGVAEYEQWLSTPVAVEDYTQAVLFTKTVLALLGGRSADDLLDKQRAAHVARMRELRRSVADGDALMSLAADFKIEHLDADLKWMESASSRLGPLRDLLKQDF